MPTSAVLLRMSLETVPTGLSELKSRLTMREPVTVTSCTSSTAGAAAGAAAGAFWAYTAVAAALDKAATTASLSSRVGGRTDVKPVGKTEHFTSIDSPWIDLVKAWRRGAAQTIGWG